VNRALIAILIALQLISLPMALHELAIQANVDPAQAACVVEHESDWNVNERGDLDERGLFQLLPSTAIWVAGEMDWEGFTLEWLDDPVKNMEMGIYILKRWPNWYSVIESCR
jgi:soluble lytic murein transglycosylase-like protein